MKKYMYVLLVLLLAALCGAEVKIMTYNIQVDSVLTPSWKARRGYVVENIRDYDPDILCLQEPRRHQLCYVVGNIGHYDYVGCGRGGGERGEYNPILYRPKVVKLLDSGTFWLSKTPMVPSSNSWGFVPRICTWVRFKELETGRQFYVYNTHFPVMPGSARMSCAKVLLKAIVARHYSEPVILAGDLNASRVSGVLELFRQYYLFDSWRLVHLEKKIGKKIDYILVFGVAVLDADIVERRFKMRPSDHKPVTALLEIVGE